MKSLAGSVLALIDGVLSALIAFVLFVISLIFFINPGILSIVDMGISQYLVGFFIFIGVMLFVIIAWAKIYCSKLMLNPETTRTGGIIALVVGVVTLGIFSIVGGIIGIVQGDNKKKR